MKHNKDFTLKDIEAIQIVWAARSRKALRRIGNKMAKKIPEAGRQAACSGDRAVGACQPPPVPTARSPRCEG